MEIVKPVGEVAQLYTLVDRNQTVHPTKLRALLASHEALRDRERRLLHHLTELLGILRIKSKTNHEMKLIAEAQKEVSR